MLKKIAFWGLTGILALLGAGPGEGIALGAPMAQPNVYDLAVVGKNIHISYSSTSLSGEPQLIYRDTKGTRTFRGDDIRVEPTEIGRLVTVTLEQIPDLRTITLTVLIPDINLYANVVPFQTQAITTTHRTSIGGPGLVKGPIQTYVAAAVNGRARHVDFIAPGQSRIEGEVILSPTCPGPQRPGQICQKPFADAAVVIFDPQQKIVGSTMTNAQGKFAVDVAPGAYTVHIDTPGPLPHCPDTPVKVQDAGSTFVRINCDTGIR